MKTAELSLNPFSLMMEPELVLQTMERSQQLRSLRRHKLRPLDKPLIPYTARKPWPRAPHMTPPSTPKTSKSRPTTTCSTNPARSPRAALQCVASRAIMAAPC